MKHVLLLIVALIFSLASCKSTQEAVDNNVDKESQDSRRFDRLDKNQDNKISKSELSGHLAKRFDNLDKNNDGFLSPQEMKNAPILKGKPRQIKKN